MSKIIRLKKGIFDQTHPAIPEEQTINYTSQRLIEWLHQIRAFLPCIQ